MLQRKFSTFVAVVLMQLLSVSLVHADKDFSMPDTPLNSKQTIRREFRTGDQHTYFIELNSGDFLELAIEPEGIFLNVTAYGPDEARISKLGESSKPITLGIVADRSGVYRILVDSPHEAKSGKYQIKISNRLSLEERVPSVRSGADEKNLSPKIAQLRKQIQAGNYQAVEQFWDESSKQGSPLIESIEGDQKNRLVTFLWKHQPNTHNVVVFINPFTEKRMDDYKMSRLENSDIWFKTLSIRKEARFLYGLVPNAPARFNMEDSSLFFGALQSDPLNPKWRATDCDNPHPSKYERMSILEMPEAPTQIWAKNRVDVTPGDVKKFSYRSEILKNDRQIAVYTPAKYNPKGESYPLLILFDALPYLTFVPTPTILDNLIAAGKIPPVVAVLIDYPYPEGEYRTRELACNKKFSDFLSTEFIGWVRQHYNVTQKPEKTVIAGSSLGGLAAACAGFYHSEVFGNILSQSGSFWWTSDFDSENPGPPNIYAEPNTLAKEFIRSPKLPLRFYMDAGSNEVDLDGRGHHILLTSRNLRDVLRAKGYEVSWQEFIGGHDYLSWRGTLADGLIELFGRGSHIP